MGSGVGGDEEDADREQAPKWVIAALDANPLPVPAAHRPAATGCHLQFSPPLLVPVFFFPSEVSRRCGLRGVGEALGAAEKAIAASAV